MGGELYQLHQVLDIVIGPLAQIVSFIVTQPKGPLGYGLNAGIANEIIDDVACGSFFNRVGIRGIERLRIVLYEEFKGFAETGSCDLFKV